MDMLPKLRSRRGWVFFIFSFSFCFFDRQLDQLAQWMTFTVRTSTISLISINSGNHVIDLLFTISRSNCIALSLLTNGILFRFYLRSKLLFFVLTKCLEKFIYWITKSNNPEILFICPILFHRIAWNNKRNQWDGCLGQFSSFGKHI